MSYKKIISCALAASLTFGAFAYASDLKPVQKEADQSNHYKFQLQKLKTQKILSENSLNNSEVLDMYEAFTGAIEDRYLIQKFYTEDDVKKIMTAVEFSAKKHKGQKRKNIDKTPYIIHPIGVAFQIMDIAKVFDTKVIIAALLHDTLEDTKTTLDEITKLFGKDVASIVEEVTDDITLSSSQRKLNQIFHAPHLTKEAALVKTSDRLYNLRDTKTTLWNKAKIDEYFTWGKRLCEKLPRASEELYKALEDEINNHFSGSI